MLTIAMHRWHARQDLFICVEMFIAALAHRSVFTYRDFKPTVDGDAANPCHATVFPS
jgi:hypothetical protein